MNKPRYDHGLQKIAQKIFVFGGVAGGRIIKSSEVYDVVQNSWKNLPDMLEASADITCVIVKNKILISSENSRLMSYDIENEAYSQVGDQFSMRVHRYIASSKEKIYLFEINKVFEVTA